MLIFSTSLVTNMIIASKAANNNILNISLTLTLTIFNNTFNRYTNATIPLITKVATIVAGNKTTPKTARVIIKRPTFIIPNNILRTPLIVLTFLTSISILFSSVFNKFTNIMILVITKVAIRVAGNKIALKVAMPIIINPIFKISNIVTLTLLIFCLVFFVSSFKLLNDPVITFVILLIVDTNNRIAGKHNNTISDFFAVV